jgi:hypothetical protein
MVLMSMRGFPKITAAAIVGLSAGVAGALVAPAGAQGLPDGKGKELVSSTCQAGFLHGPTRATAP